MARINLLPWRETRRTEEQREFIIVTAFAAAVAAILVGYVHIHVNGMIEYQELRNQFVHNEIKVLDKKIAEIKQLEATKKALLDRMLVIQRLQAIRPGIVHLFDELITTLPDGVFLTNVTQRGTQLTIKGKAESNARVSAYMRNIAASEWLTKPVLNIIQTKESGPARISDFTLVVTQTSPQGPLEEETKK